MTQASLININMVPLRRKIARLRRRCMKNWAAAIASTLLLVGLPGAYIGGNAAFSDPAIGSQIEQVKSQLTANQLVIPRLQAELEQLRAEQEVLNLVKNRVHWQDVFSLLVGATHEDIRFTGLAAVGGGVEGADPIAIRIDGMASSQSAARSFVVELEKLGLFDTVELEHTNRRVIREQEVIEFQIFTRVNGAKSSAARQP